MAALMRTIYAPLSIAIFGIGVAIYIWSFMAHYVDSIDAYMSILYIGVFLLARPMLRREAPQSYRISFFLKGYAGKAPKGISIVGQLLLITAVIHFGLAVIGSGAGVPSTVDGEYVLEAHGKVIRVLSLFEYRHLQAQNVRAAAAVLAALSFVPMVYWCGLWTLKKSDA
jgi:hypothetical protein